MKRFNKWDIVTGVLAAIAGILGAIALQAVIKAWM
jgi:hemoglobin-like flavoprotein